MPLTDLSNLRILLVQIRDTEQVRTEELQSFIRLTGLQHHQIDVLNVFDRPEFEPEVVEVYDAVLVGGASEASVLEPDNYPFVPYCVKLLEYCCAIAKPVFASCFGFQLAVLAMGGRIVRDASDFEIGTLPISLTAEACDDPMLCETSNPFYAVSVHRERAPELPDACNLLAYTDKCPHAFKVTDKPFWAFQFHPEVDKPTLVTRLGVFQEKYTENPQHFSHVIENAKETPESNALVRRFVELLV